MSDEKGEGYSCDSSLPLPSWPEEPRPHESSWRVTASSEVEAELYNIGSLLVVVVVSVRRSWRSAIYLFRLGFFRRFLLGFICTDRLHSVCRLETCGEANKPLISLKM